MFHRLSRDGDRAGKAATSFNGNELQGRSKNALRTLHGLHNCSNVVLKGQTFTFDASAQLLLLEVQLQCMNNDLHRVKARCGVHPYVRSDCNFVQDATFGPFDPAQCVLLFEHALILARNGWCVLTLTF